MATRIMKGFMIAAMSFAALGTAPSAFAGEAVEPVKDLVKYSDLDLTTADGQKKLDSRVKSAVRNMCTLPITTGSHIRRVDQDCVDGAMPGAKKAAQVAIANYKAKRALAANETSVINN